MLLAECMRVAARHISLYSPQQLCSMPGDIASSLLEAAILTKTITDNSASFLACSACSHTNRLSFNQSRTMLSLSAMPPSGLLTSLTELDLSWSFSFTEQGLCSVLNSLPKLRNLILVRTCGVTDNVLEHAAHYGGLVEVDFSRCPDVLGFFPLSPLH